MTLVEFLKNGHEAFMPGLSVDVVIVGYEAQQLKCLLLQIGDKWLLPGGFVSKSESVEQSAYRVMHERTGLKEPHLQFLSVFGDANRGFGQEWKDYFISKNIPWEDTYWVNNRFLSLAYYSLVNMTQMHPQLSVFDEAFKWFSFDELPHMWMDHEQIVNKARAQIKTDVINNPITYNLLPETFTMPELHQLHQTILQKEIDRSRFQKKMLSLEIFERMEELAKDRPGRNPYLYRLKAISALPQE